MNKRKAQRENNKVLKEALARYRASTHKCKICGKTCAFKYDLCLDCFQDYGKGIKRVHQNEISAKTSSPAGTEPKSDKNPT